MKGRNAIAAALQVALTLEVCLLRASDSHAGDPETLKKIHLCVTDDSRALEALDGLPAGARLAAHRDRVWKDRSTLRVRFLGGNDELRQMVEHYATDWCMFANIAFIFGDDPDAEIRVAFMEGRGSWSAVGSDALNRPKDEPTMNFGWLREDPGGARRVVTHEFGHALGFIHEHQSPKAGIRWNEPLVYAYCRFASGWSRDKTYHNILRRYSRDSTNATSFDRESIMLYGFPDMLTLDGRGTQNNARLSAMDKRHAARLYPWTPQMLMKVVNSTHSTVRFRYRLENNAQWFPEASLGPRQHLLIWENAGKEEHFWNFLLRYFDGEREQTDSREPGQWRPKGEGDYPDFSQAKQYEFVTRGAKVGLVRNP